MFRKKTKEEQLQFRIEEVFLHLTKSSDFTFTELETVQILNSVKRKAYEYLEKKKADCLDEATKQTQKANYILTCLDLFE